MLLDSAGLHPSGEHAAEGLVAKAAQRVDQGCVGSSRERVRQRKLQSLSGINVLIEYAEGKSSALSKAASELGIQGIIVDRNTVDLSTQAHVEQVCGQVEAMPGCDLLLSLPSVKLCLD